MGFRSPAYVILERSGPDHAPKFRIAVAIQGLDPAIGSGTSKRAAEQNAAESLLVRERIWEGPGHGRTDSETQSETRCGFVALIGAPNAGKSTLLNALVGSKVSIVSRKVQTTRAWCAASPSKAPAQIVFVDTPGIFKPKRRLDRAMVTSAWSGAGDADVVCLLLDVRKGLDEENAAILEKLPDLRQPKILILNKIDADRAGEAARPRGRPQRGVRPSPIPS